MKKFLLKVVLFLVLFFTSIALPVVLEVAVCEYKLSLELPKDKTILFTGDSHIEYGVNDNLIPCSFNWARGGDNYLNLFPRTKKMLDANPQIHTVFVSVTPISLGEDGDEKIFNGNAGILLRLNIIFYESDELEDIANGAVDLRSSQTILKFIRPKNLMNLGKLRVFGGFKDTGNSSKEFGKEIENGGKWGKEKYSSTGKYGNELSVKYLRKIVELVRARGGKIIFLNTPIYHAEEFFDVPYFESILKEKFPDVEFWDYGDFPMPEDCFLNVNHLNGNGAEVFSRELAKCMRDEGIIEP